jgi:hypothetical protein
LQCLEVWLLIVIARWSDGRLGDVIEGLLVVVGSIGTGRRELTVDEAVVGMRLVDTVVGIAGRDDDTAALSWLTIDLTRFLPSETDESVGFCDSVILVPLTNCCFFPVVNVDDDCCWVVLLTELFVIVDDWFVIPVGFRIADVVVVVVVIAVDVLFAIIDFIGLVIVEEEGFSLLEDGTIFDGCFKRETFVIVDGVVIVRFGSCETDLLAFLLRLPFVDGGTFVVLEIIGRVGLVLPLRRTVEAEDVVLLADDDELLFKWWDGGECV